MGWTLVVAGRTKEWEEDEEGVGQGRGEWQSGDYEGEEGGWFEDGGDELVGDGEGGDCEEEEEWVCGDKEEDKVETDIGEGRGMLG